MLLLLLDKESPSTKSRDFSAHIEKHLEKLHIDYQISNFEQTEFFIEPRGVDVLIENLPISTWSTIYPRKVGRQKCAAHLLARVCNRSSIRFLDPFHKQIKDASDSAKIVQIFNLAQAEVPIPKTYFSPSYTDVHIENASKYLGFPVVVKESNTSHGLGVFLAKNQEDLKDILQARQALPEKRTLFLQEFIDNTFEYRLLVLGSTVAVAEKKVRDRKREFRNNVHLGATEEFINPTLVELTAKEAAILAAETTNIEVAGVDVVINKEGCPIIFEVNSCPEFTLDEEISNEIEKLSEYLALCERT